MTTTRECPHCHGDLLDGKHKLDELFGIAVLMCPRMNPDDWKMVKL